MIELRTSCSQSPSSPVEGRDRQKKHNESKGKQHRKQENMCAKLYCRAYHTASCWLELEHGLWYVFACAASEGGDKSRGDFHLTGNSLAYGNYSQKSAARKPRESEFGIRLELRASPSPTSARPCTKLNKPQARLYPGTAH